MASRSDKEPVYDAQSIVCLKSERDGDALVHFPFEGHFITVCCPLCFEALKADPPSYLKRKLPLRQDNPSF